MINHRLIKWILLSIRKELNSNAAFFIKHKIFSAFILMAITGMFFIFSFFHTLKRFSWEEEVLLSTGETIVVERYAALSGYSYFGGGSGVYIHHTKLKVIKGSEESYPTEWDYNEVPLIFDKDPDNGQWFIISTWYSSHHNNASRNVKQHEYRYINDEWIPIKELSRKFIDNRMPANLISRVKFSGEEYLTIELKKERLKWGLSKDRCVTNQPTIRNGC